MPQFNTKYAIEFINSVKGVSDDCSTFKTEVYRSILMNREIDRYSIQKFLGSINSYLRIWSEYATDLLTACKNVGDIDEKDIHARVISYDEIKKYLYESFDYPSVLQYTDGVAKGIRDGKFTEVKDIVDFYEYTTDKAFDGITTAANGGAMITAINSIMERRNEPKKIDVKYFKQVCTHQLFSKSDRQAIYKSIERIVNFFAYALGDYVDLVKQSKLCAAMINYVFEYIKYTLAVYGGRIMAISLYAEPFIRAAANKAAGDVAPVNYEAADIGLNPEKSVTNFTYTKMRDLEDSTYRDPEKYPEYIKFALDWLKIIGGMPNHMDDDNTATTFRYCFDYQEKDNVFANALTGNELFDNLIKCGTVDVATDDIGLENRYRKTFQMMKDLLSAPIGVSGVPNPKNEILTMIKNTKPEHETVDSYAKLGFELIKFTGCMMSNISEVVRSLKSCRSKEANEHKFRNSFFILLEEFTKMLSDLYREIYIASIYRCRDIEMKLNELRNARDERTSDMFAIKIPGFKNSDYSSHDNTMSGVPDKMSAMMDDIITEMFAAPYFDELTMYDEYVMTLPGMADDPYFAEAVNFNVIINKIIAWIKGQIRKFEVMFNDAAFKNAVKWVEAHRSTMLSMTFNGEMEVKKYPAGLNIAHFDKVIQELNNFKGETDAKNKEAVDKFERKLYLDDQAIYDLFHGADEHKNAKFQNYVVFGTNVKAPNAEKPPVEKLTGDTQIKAGLRIWIPAVLSAPDVHVKINETSKNIEAAVNHVKAEVVAITNKMNQQAKAPANNTTGNDQAPPSMSGAEEARNEAIKKVNTAVEEIKTQGGEFVPESAVVAAEKAIVNLFTSMYTIITGAIKDQYKYIQEAYTIGRSASQTAATPKKEEPKEEPPVETATSEQ